MRYSRCEWEGGGDPNLIASLLTGRGWRGELSKAHLFIQSLWTHVVVKSSLKVKNNKRREIRLNIFLTQGWAIIFVRGPYWSILSIFGANLFDKQGIQSTFFWLNILKVGWKTTSRAIHKVSAAGFCPLLFCTWIKLLHF